MQQNNCTLSWRIIAAASSDGLGHQITHMRTIQSLMLSTGICLSLSACEKSSIEAAETYVEPSEYRVGHYVGMFQECGTTICYD